MGGDAATRRRGQPIIIGGQVGNAASFASKATSAIHLRRGRCAAFPRSRQFSVIWLTDDLLVSFDTFISWRSFWGGASAENIPRLEGYHQNPWLHCIQGMLPLLPVTPEIGGLAEEARSHGGTECAALRDAHPGWKAVDDFCLI